MELKNAPLQKQYKHHKVNNKNHNSSTADQYAIAQA